MSDERVWFIWTCDCPRVVHDDPEEDGPVICSRCKGQLLETEVRLGALEPSAPEEREGQVTDGMVERAARCLWTMRTESTEDLWANEELHGDERAMYRTEARLILAAALDASSEGAAGVTVTLDLFDAKQVAEVRPGGRGQTYWDAHARLVAVLRTALDSTTHNNEEGDDAR